MDIEVPEAHAALLRTCCGFDEYAELPEKLIKAYWNLKRICDRVQDSMTISDLKHLAYGQGYGKILEREANPTVVEQYRAGKLKRESGVEVVWGKGTRHGSLKRVDGQGRCIVQLDGDSEERPFAGDKVKVAELATA